MRSVRHCGRGDRALHLYGQARPVAVRDDAVIELADVERYVRRTARLPPVHGRGRRRLRGDGDGHADVLDVLAHLPDRGHMLFDLLPVPVLGIASVFRWDTRNQLFRWRPVRDWSVLYTWGDGTLGLQSNVESPTDVFSDRGQRRRQRLGARATEQPL